MSRILLSSYAPPPLIGNAKIEAAHCRTWQLLEPLLNDGDYPTVMQATAFRAGGDRGIQTVVGFVQEALKIGDWRSLADHVVTLAGNRAQTGAMSAHARTRARDR